MFSSLCCSSPSLQLQPEDNAGFHLLLVDVDPGPVVMASGQGGREIRIKREAIAAVSSLGSF